MLDMKGAMIAYNPCHKCENTQMCSMCEITYYRKVMGVNNAVTGKKNTGKEDHDMVDDAPTVDAVEVVRCKDCKHWADGVAGCTDQVKCCKIGFYMVGENGYCVYGERRTDETL